MKAFFALTLMIMALAFTSCLEDECQSSRTYQKWTPVYVTEDGLRPEISNQNTTDLVSPGKIYTYNNYLFINELRKGVHVIDNSIPENPRFVNFIEIPGNVDIAIRGNTLYADMYRDLVSIDISDVNNAVLTEREKNVFESYIPFDPNEDKYIISYEATPETITVSCQDDRWGQSWFRGGPDVFIDASAGLWNASSSLDFSGAPSGIRLATSSSSVGTGGSLARFTIAKEHLYALDDSRINVFKFERESLIQKNTVEVSRGIETIFPYRDYLFIGSMSGMFIYDIEDPSLPNSIASFSHAMACDPVFVDDDIAYVTLRDGVACTNQTNQIDVIDVSNITRPKLLKSFPMTNPHGLSVLNDVLYLCEGEDGLKIFDVADPEELGNNRIDHIKGFSTYDVIALNQGLLLVIGPDGFYQYDITNPKSIQEISFLPVIKS